MRLPNRPVRFTLKRILFTLTASLALGALPLAVSAQNIQYDSLRETARRGGFPLGVPSIPTVAATIISSVLGFVGTVLLLFVLYAGFLWLTAAGSEEKIAKAKKILVSAAIGLFIVFAGYAISAFIIRTVKTATTATSTPPQVACQPNVLDPCGASAGGAACCSPHRCAEDSPGVWKCASS